MAGVAVLKVISKMLQVVIPVGAVFLLVYSIVPDRYLASHNDMQVQAVIFIATLTTLALITFKYMRGIIIFAKSVFVGERAQSMALLETLSKMVKKLEYRDKVLIIEKEQAVASNIAKSDFLVSMSHELRTPMHAILNFADIGKSCAISNDIKKIETCFLRIEESGERLLKLINGLLDLTRLESGKVNFKFLENDMLACIGCVKNEMTATLEKKAITIDIININSVHILKFDKDHIIRVLVNILSNAIKFSPEHSSITITLEYGRYTIGEKKNVKGLKVSVADHGPGIEEDEKEMIFQKFIQGTKKPGHPLGGSGVGLAICKEIIAAHNGVIWSENREEGGALVSFIIPG